MRTTGITRKVDDLGRVVIPAGIRRALEIVEGDTVEVAIEGDRVVMAKPVDRCVFCASTAGPFRSFHGKTVCDVCVAGLTGERMDTSFPPAPADLDGADLALIDQSPASSTAW